MLYYLSSIFFICKIFFSTHSGYGNGIQKRSFIQGDLLAKPDKQLSMQTSRTRLSSVFSSSTTEIFNHRKYCRSATQSK